jgi:hypothetical protein
VQKAFLFVYNAVSLLFYKCETCPSKAAEVIFQAILAAIDFLFADDKRFDRVAESRSWRKEFFETLIGCLKNELQNGSQ